MADEAIIIGEGWLSEHYFTTDAKSQSFHARALARRKEWDVQDSDGTPSVRARFSAIRAQLESRLATLVPRSGDLSIRDDVYRPLRDALGLHSGGYHLEQDGPLLRVTQPGLSDGSPFVVVEGRPADTLEDLLSKDAETLLVPFEVDDNEKHAITSVARALSTLFVEEDGPVFALVMAGQWLLVAEKERWAEGRYLAVDLQLVVSRNDTRRGGEIDRALTCVAAEALAPDAEGDIWWTSILEESIKHTVGVSQDLREGVRLSIEIIANDVVARRRRAGLEPLPQREAQTLAKQSLRFLYRILFLLYAEASPELKVLPVGASEYEEGYSLDRLRELTLVTLANERAEHGTHLYESLVVLFHLVDRGHGSGRQSVEHVETTEEEAADEGLREGLTFNSLRADLFLPKATSLIDAVKLSDSELQKVLAHLLLSKEQKGRDRGFISYADLGINQLGAVYEGLMSYTGFFAETQLYEVARDGNSEKGSWVVPIERAQGIEAKDFVRLKDPITGEVRSVIHETGSFVFRLAGRERQQSASFYTPEVLTQFTVAQALEELLDQNGETTTAAEILDLTVCEPALGSGAFALEAVRQLAEQYLKRRQRELGLRIDPDEYPRELQKAKASIALHQVYGVDLNATAVELAEVSLWLDTMSEDLQAPWFGLHLKRGNSLIGARHAVYSRDQVVSKSWLKAVPRDVPISESIGGVDGRVSNGAASVSIHHFLLPAEGWGSAVYAKESNELAPEALAALKKWRRQFRSKPTKKQVDQLVSLSSRVETLWRFALRRLEIAEREIRRKIPLWGAPPTELTQLAETSRSPVTREEIEAKLSDAEGAYQRLRRVMDAWNALWFWPLTDGLTEGVQPPTLDEWISGVRIVLGEHTRVTPAAAEHGGTTLGMSSGGWDELNSEERDELEFASASPIAVALDRFPWLRVTERIATQHGFFHWELDFATVFARGGFDLQVGNPPWVRPRTDVDSLLAEGDPWWQLRVKSTQAEESSKRSETLTYKGMAGLLIDGTAEVAAATAYLGAPTNYPSLIGLQPDLYRCFMELAWRHGSSRGATGLIHPESHFTEERGGRLRSATYARLRRHWQFANELKLFEIQNQKRFGVNIYGPALSDVSFLTAAYLLHPDTIARSFSHDGTGAVPGIRNTDGGWDLRPHAGRISRVTQNTLHTWSEILGTTESVPDTQVKMLFLPSDALMSTLDSVVNTRRFSSLPVEYSAGWIEGADNVNKGVFEVGWGRAPSWADAILQGTFLDVATPFYKHPNETMRHNRDTSQYDRECMAENELPITSFEPSVDKNRYRALYGNWSDGTPILSSYRVAWRAMADNASERTLRPALIPPGPAHVDGISSLGMPALPGSDLVEVAGSLSSLLCDFVVRAAPKSTIRPSVVRRLPVAYGHALRQNLILRTLRLNALTGSYAELWAECFTAEWGDDNWAGGIQYEGRPKLSDVGPEWTVATPFRRQSDRYQALVELDALVAIMFGVPVDALCTVYRTQFPVLYGYDRNSYHYDTNGRLVPNSVLTTWRSKGERITRAERTATNAAGNSYTYETPFVTLDRQADMRQAYAHFETILQKR